jgi:hypothetical protein
MLGRWMPLGGAANQAADAPAIGASASEAAIRARIGRWDTGAGRDIRALAELVVGERLSVAAVAVWKRRGWVVAATDRGLRMTRRPWLFGRPVDERFAWGDLTSVWSGGMDRVELVFGERSVELVAVTPRDEYLRLLEMARRQVYGDDGRSSVDEIRRLAQETLGRFTSTGEDSAIDGLPDRLEPGERVAALATAKHGFSGLLAVTQSRVILLHVPMRAGTARLWTADRQDIRAAEVSGTGVRLDTTSGQVRLEGILPNDRLDELASLLSPAGAHLSRWAQPAAPTGAGTASRDELAAESDLEVPGTRVPVRMPVTPGSRLEAAVQDGPRRYAVTDGSAECGRLLLEPNHAAYRAVTAAHTCDLWVTGTWSWTGVAADPECDEAIAGYYPGLLWNGTLVFEDHRYRLREKRLSGEWQLRGRRGVVARLRYLTDDLPGTYVCHTWPICVEIGPRAEETARADLLVLLFIWIVGLEASVPRGWP